MDDMVEEYKLLVAIYNTTFSYMTGSAGCSTYNLRKLWWGLGVRWILYSLLMICHHDKYLYFFYLNLFVLKYFHTVISVRLWLDFFRAGATRNTKRRRAVFLQTLSQLQLFHLTLLRYFGGEPLLDPLPHPKQTALIIMNEEKLRIQCEFKSCLLFVPTQT